jgi:hypothetical protein
MLIGFRTLASCSGGRCSRAVRWSLQTSQVMVHSAVCDWRRSWRARKGALVLTLDERHVAPPRDKRPLGFGQARSILGLPQASAAGE